MGRGTGLRPPHPPPGPAASRCGLTLATTVQRCYESRCPGRNGIGAATDDGRIAIGEIRMPKVRVNGIELNYVEAGSGDPLLLIMGFGGDHLAWAFQVPAFSAKYRVISFDNRGAGQSSVPDVPYSTRMMADDAVGLLDALGSSGRTCWGCRWAG